jgi:hypothetical protein
MAFGRFDKPPQFLAERFALDAMDTNQQHDSRTSITQSFLE